MLKAVTEPTERQKIFITNNSNNRLDSFFCTCLHPNVLIDNCNCIYTLDKMSLVFLFLNAKQKCFPRSLKHNIYIKEILYGTNIGK